MIDVASRAKGEVLYKQHCASCHNPINRTDENSKVTARLSDEGTDQNMIRNFGAIVKTGKLKGQQSAARTRAIRRRGTARRHSETHRRANHT